MEKKYSQKEINGFINLAHKNIVRKKGKEYSPSVHEIQKWIDEYISDKEQLKTSEGSELSEKNALKGGLSDKMSLKDIAVKHVSKKSDKGEVNKMLKTLKQQLRKGLKVEMEHVDDEDKAKEIVMDHLFEDPEYYDKLSKMEMGEKWSEKYKKSIDCNNPKGFSQKAHCQGRKKQDTKESTGADSAGAFEPAFGSAPIKRKINVIHNLKEEEEFKEATSASSSGAYDVPFGDGGKNPLKIGGPESIKKSRAVKDKNFPKWGGPKGVYVKVKEKCKKFPYCNQGNTGAIEFYEVDGLVESIKEVSKEKGIPYSELEKIVLNEINKIFIK